MDKNTAPCLLPTFFDLSLFLLFMGVSSLASSPLPPQPTPSWPADGILRPTRDVSTADIRTVCDVTVYQRGSIGERETSLDELARFYGIGRQSRCPQAPALPR